MDFIGVDGSIERIALHSRVHPVIIIPSILVDIMHNSSSCRPDFEEKSIRVGFERKKVTRGTQDLEFILCTFIYAGDENVPHARSGVKTERMTPPIPKIEFPHHADAPSVGGPD